MNEIVTIFRKLFGFDTKSRVKGVKVIRLPIFNDGSQIVVAVFKSGVEYPIHSHEQDEKIYFASGEGKISISNQSFDYKNGDSFLIKKGEIHSYSIKTKTTLISIQEVAIKY